MSIKTLFGEIAVALSHLKSAADKVLHSDQQAAIDNALAALKAAELEYETHLKADVMAALEEAVAGLAFVSQAVFDTAINDLGGRVAALEEAKTDTEAGLSDMKSALEDLGRLVAPLETVGAGAGDDSIDAGGGGDETLDAGGGDDSIPAGAGDDSLDGGGGNDSLDGGGAPGPAGDETQSG